MPKYVMNKFLCRFLVILAVSPDLLYAKDHLLTDEQIRQDVRALLAMELKGLYDVTSVTILSRDSSHYGDEAIRIRFQSIKNANG